MHQLPVQVAPRDGHIVFQAAVLLECETLASTMCKCFIVARQLLYYTFTCSALSSTVRVQNSQAYVPADN